MDTILVTTHRFPTGGFAARRAVEPVSSSRTSRVAAAAALALPVVWLDLYVIARSMDPGVAWGAVFGGQVLIALAITLLVRRAAAGSMFSSMPANRAVGHLLGALVLLPYSVYAESHRTMRLRARRADGSNWALDGRASTGLAIDMTPRRWLGYRTWSDASRILAGEVHDETHPRLLIRSALVSVVACAWMLSVVAIGLRFEAVAVLAGWVVPVVVAQLALAVAGRIVRSRRVPIDRTTNAFEVVLETRGAPAQAIVPAARRVSISAGE